MTTASDWIEHLQLQPHPEGGYFKEVYRASETIPHHALPSRFQAERHFSTSIYFLLTSTTFSAFHRIQQDELWHFYDGAPLTIHIIDANGTHTSTQLGRHFLAGETPQTVIKAGVWFAACLTEPNTHKKTKLQQKQIDDSDYTLVGCTVSPGFDFADFELAERKHLLAQFPQHHTLINALTR